jgi:hypothetical protein
MMVFSAQLACWGWGCSQLATQFHSITPSARATSPPSPFNSKAIARYSYLYFPLSPSLWFTPSPYILSPLVSLLHFSETPPSPPPTGLYKVDSGTLLLCSFYESMQLRNYPFTCFSSLYSSDYKESNYTPWKLDFYLLFLTFSSLVMFFVLLIKVILFVRMLYIFSCWSFTLYLTVTFFVLLCTMLTNN